MCRCVGPVGCDRERGGPVHESVDGRNRVHGVVSPRDAPDLHRHEETETADKARVVGGDPCRGNEGLPEERVNTFTVLCKRTRTLSSLFYRNFGRSDEHLDLPRTPPHPPRPNLHIFLSLQEGRLLGRDLPEGRSQRPRPDHPRRRHSS